MNCQDEHTVLRVLDKYIARDNLALKQYRLNKLQQRNVVFYQRQSDYLNNTNNNLNQESLVANGKKFLWIK